MQIPETLQTTNQIFQAVFGRDNPYPLDKLKEKFAFDIILPTQVQDSKIHETTWTALPNSKLYITNQNSDKVDAVESWFRPKKPLKNLRELLAAWEEINYITTERVYNSENVTASDPIYESINVYNSTNCGECKNIIFCDGTYKSEYALACQRSNNCNFCIRVDDSNACTNSYNVICSGKISNSLFIQDCGSLHECIFCSHISNHEFCIANMQFPENEYYYLKQQIIKWIFSDLK